MITKILLAVCIIIVFMLVIIGFSLMYTIACIDLEEQQTI